MVQAGAAPNIEVGAIRHDEAIRRAFVSGPIKFTTAVVIAAVAEEGRRAISSVVCHGIRLCAVTCGFRQNQL